MAFLTFDELRSQHFQKAELINESRNFSYVSDKIIFLSYRRKDRVWVKPIVDLLHKLGVRVYVDYLDNSLTDKPNSAAAGILRSRIKNSDKFVMMATPNSSESKWIPWELGLGDGFDGYDNTVILPLTNSSSYWGDQEYFEIYGYVKKAYSKDNTRHDWAIFYPNGDAIWLKEWIEK